MSGHQHRRLPWLVAAVTLAFLTVGTSPAAAHKHPTPIERASPGVVFIEARAKVEVALIEHRQAGDSFGVHIGIIQSTWNPVLDTASGFVVDPTGAIVTTGAITRPDLDRARIFAVNQAFHQRYGDAAPLPKDPFSRTNVGGLGSSGDRNEERLQACYPPNVTNDAGGCVVRVTPDYVVYPYVTSQQRYGGLHAEVLGGTSDVAILRVRGANSMPTVAVGTSTAGAEALGVLGFTGIPGADNPLQEINQHLATKGGDQLKTTGLDAGDVRDAAKLAAGLQHGMAGGPVLAERGDVVGLLPSAPRPGQRRATTGEHRLGAAPPDQGGGQPARGPCRRQLRGGDAPVQEQRLCRLGPQLHQGARALPRALPGQSQPRHRQAARRLRRGRVGDGRGRDGRGRVHAGGPDCCWRDVWRYELVVAGRHPCSPSPCSPQGPC